MKFGQVDKPGKIDFTIPPDHPETPRILKDSDPNELEIFIGCAKWNKTDLKNFYPRGVKNELEYYSSQFNSIELNATFYRNFPADVYQEWYSTVPAGFKFFPKLEQTISHFRRLNDVVEVVDEVVTNMSLLREKLGMTFLQLNSNFAPKDFDRVQLFLANWKYDMPLAIEFRHTNWYNDDAIAAELFDLMEKNRVTSVLVDTAGRRDLMHIRLTGPTAFVRWVGANHRSDRKRLDEWLERIVSWREQGLTKLYFFVHQNVEKESPQLSAYLIRKLNKRLGTKLKIPKTLK